MPVVPGPCSRCKLRTSKSPSVEIRDERGIPLIKGLGLSQASTTIAVGLLRPGAYYVVVSDPQSGAQASLPFIKL
ncbi:hypothetical protein GCM10028786_21810 [Flaviaesturariibacter terrae]